MCLLVCLRVFAPVWTRARLFYLCRGFAGTTPSRPEAHRSETLEEGDETVANVPCAAAESLRTQCIGEREKKVPAETHPTPEVEDFVLGKVGREHLFHSSRNWVLNICLCKYESTVEDIQEQNVEDLQPRLWGGHDRGGRETLNLVRLRSLLGLKSEMLISRPVEGQTSIRPKLNFLVWGTVMLAKKSSPADLHCLNVAAWLKTTAWT